MKLQKVINGGLVAAINKAFDLKEGIWFSYEIPRQEIGNNNSKIHYITFFNENDEPINDAMIIEKSWVSELYF